jgi:hypothetical protein
MVLLIVVHDGWILSQLPADLSEPSFLLRAHSIKDWESQRVSCFYCWIFTVELGDDGNKKRPRWFARQEIEIGDCGAAAERNVLAVYYEQQH